MLKYYNGYFSSTDSLSVCKMRLHYSTAIYNYYLKRLDYKKAYRSRIENYIMLEKKQTNEKSNKYTNYLNEINDNSLYRFFGLNNKYISYLESRKSNYNVSNIIDKQENFTKEQVDSIALIGPSANLFNLDLNEYDYIFFNKPINIEKNNIEEKKVCLILNNTWSIFKKDDIVKFSIKYPKAKIFSPNKLHIKNEINDVFLSIPEYPDSGLQGFQRALVVIFNYFKLNKIFIEGFNFFLDDQPYKDWYPSLLEDEFGDYMKGIYLSSIKHDYLLNILFAKNFISSLNKEVIGDINNYLPLNIYQILEKYFDKFKSYDFRKSDENEYRNASYR